MATVSTTDRMCGMEDYTFLRIDCNILTDTYINEYALKAYSWDTGRYYFIPEKTVLNQYGMKYVDTDFIVDHKELLETAKTIYVHPNCKVSRTLLSQKYKKTLNPWAADVIVFPQPSKNHFSTDDTALFVNDAAKLVTVMKASDYVKKFNKGVLLRHIILYQSNIKNFEFRTDLGYSPIAMLDSTLEYCGPLATVERRDSYIIDLLNHTIPTEKTVFEDTIMKSLGNTENKPTLENLISIRDMLDSKDSDVVTSALKALASMDYVNYPNSVITILRDNIYNWRYNKAITSTSVKYMLKSLLGRTFVGKWIGYNKETISQEDFNLLQQLINHLSNDNEQYARLQYYSEMPFMFKDCNMQLLPRLE